jgi:hypothetical protein
MADAEDPLEFFERGVGVFLDLDLKLLRIEFAPVPPTGFGGERASLGGGEVAVDRAATQIETPSRFGLGSTFLDELDHPLPQV